MGRLVGACFIIHIMLHALEAKRGAKMKLSTCRRQGMCKTIMEHPGGGIAACFKLLGAWAVRNTDLKTVTGAICGGC